MQINDCSKLGEEGQKVGPAAGPVCTVSTTTLAEGAVMVASLLTFYVRLTITPHKITERIKMRGVERARQREERGGKQDR